MLDGINHSSWGSVNFEYAVPVTWMRPDSELELEEIPDRRPQVKIEVPRWITPELKYEIRFQTMEVRISFALRCFNLWLFLTISTALPLSDRQIVPCVFQPLHFTPFLDNTHFGTSTSWTSVFILYISTQLNGQNFLVPEPRSICIASITCLRSLRMKCYKT